MAGYDDYDDEDFEEADDLSEDDLEDEDDGDEPYSPFDDTDPYGYDDDPNEDEDDPLEDKEEKKNKKKKKGDNEEAEEGNEQNGFSLGKMFLRGKTSKIDTAKMNSDALRHGCGNRTKYKCPFCKQNSIYPESVVSRLIRKAITFGRNQKEYFVCLNKNCQAYYFSPDGESTEFIVGYTGNLKPATFTGKPKKMFSMRSILK